MERILIVGGASGIGKSIAVQLLKKGVKRIYIVDKNELDNSDMPEEIQLLFNRFVTSFQVNLNSREYEVFEKIEDIDALFITAGFGRLARFEDISVCEINNLITCNELAPIRIIKNYYNKIRSFNPFYCAVMVSISGHLVSPYFSVYGASKAGLSMFIENVNSELNAQGFENRILDCSPGFIEGTGFNNNNNDYSKTKDLALEIIERTKTRSTIYIPKYEEIYKNVIYRYHSEPDKFALESYKYKKNSDRITCKPQCVIGYLSGTFDLFHIGHLNLLRNAKKHCDYLIVGVHQSGAWKGKETFISLEERKEIVAACKYVDKVVDSCSEDSDAWKKYKYDKLIVGSDYKGSERFKKYELFFTDKNVEIIYLPYTKSTSSTQLRKALLK